ncbi:MAG: hypothetical protein GY820_01875 [Gammaproteobacteria bacterium]|nr:hypothetical protein [Gammaproteobacteria bacterium]
MVRVLEVSQCGEEVDHFRVEVLVPEEREEIGEEDISDIGKIGLGVMRGAHRKGREGEAEDRSRHMESQENTRKGNWVKKRKRRSLLPLHPLHPHHQQNDRKQQRERRLGMLQNEGGIEREY